MKKILFIIATIFIVFIIYLGNADKKIYYVNIGNKDNYTKNVIDYLNKNKIYQKYYSFSNPKYRVIDIVNLINNNETINNITLKQALIKSDLVSIYIGENDIYNIIMHDNYTKNEKYSYIDEYIYQLSYLFELIRKYCKEKIVIIPNINLSKNIEYDNYLNYLNEKCIQLAKKFNIVYLYLDDIDKYINNGITQEGFDYISNKIISKIKNS